MDAEQTLIYLAKLLLLNLEELENVSDEIFSQFLYGEKTAYVECLEAIQLWDKAKPLGLDFDVEKQYSL